MLTKEMLELELQRGRIRMEEGRRWMKSNIHWEVTPQGELKAWRPGLGWVSPCSP